MSPLFLHSVKYLQPSIDSSMEEGCSDLIQYPEDNAWIKSASQQSTITGDEDATWYLNGLKLIPQLKQAQITEPGINIITAKRGDCTETNKFFVDF